MSRTFTSHSELYDYLKGLLNAEFDIDPDTVKPESTLVEDLDLDSIDAVNLLIELKNETGKKVDVGSFKDIETFQDLSQTLFAALGS